jgi:hypothetical protein
MSVCWRLASRMYIIWEGYGSYTAASLSYLYLYAPAVYILPWLFLATASAEKRDPQHVVPIRKTPLPLDTDSSLTLPVLHATLAAILPCPARRMRSQYSRPLSNLKKPELVFAYS